MQKRFVAFLIAVLVAAGAGVATAQERFGGLTGIVTDASGAVLPGATVTITSKTTGAARTIVTSSDGLYNVPDLDPGRYAMVVELSGFAKVSMDDVAVSLGKTLKVDAQLKVGDMTEVVQVQADARPAIDSRSTLVAHNVTAEEIDRMPKGRSFQSLALTAPSVNSGEIEGGFQVNGASGAENAFTVDGVVTNSLIDGSSRQNTVFEYLQEVQVKTTGIAAEYGGALGGVISAVTKSGGNTFRGEAHYYYEGSRPQRRSGQAARARPVGRRDRHVRAGQQGAGSPQRDRRIDRRSDRPGQAVLLRVLLAAVRPPHQRLPLPATAPRPARSSASRPDAGVRQGDLQRPPHHGLGLGALHADDVRGHAAGLQRRRREHHHQLDGGQRRSTSIAASSRRRPTPPATWTSS